MFKRLFYDEIMNTRILAFPFIVSSAKLARFRPVVNF